jgi:predicted RNA-binding Zn-ribbon protein involved in translation (DUF1610 family)
MYVWNVDEDIRLHLSEDIMHFTCNECGEVLNTLSTKTYCANCGWDITESIVDFDNLIVHGKRYDIVKYYENIIEKILEKAK